MMTENLRLLIKQKWWKRRENWGEMQTEGCFQYQKSIANDF